MKKTNDDKLKVMFIIPYVSRDLDGCALVGYVLKEKYGIESIYVNGYETIKKIFKYKPDAIIWDHLTWDFKVNDLKYAHKLGIKTFCLPTEGFVMNQRDAIKATGEYHGSESSLDIFFTWGQYVKDAILHYKSLPDNKIAITGCPRFDFYNTDIYSGFYLTRKEFTEKHSIKNPDAPIIIWAPTSVQIGRDIKDRLRLYTARGDNSVEEITKVFEDGQIEYNIHGALIEDLAKRHPDWNFIIKIHPAASVEPYVKFKENNSNIYLGFNSHIRDYLYHGNILLQRNCTTATESWLLNKPTIQLEITKYNFGGSEDFLSGSKVCHTPQEIENCLIEVLKNGNSIIDLKTAAFRNDYIEKHYHRIDGKASFRVASIIKNLIGDINDKLIRMNSILQEDITYTENQNKKLSNRLKDILFIPRNKSLRFWNILKNRNKSKITEGEREATFQEINNLYNKFNEINPLIHDN